MHDLCEACWHDANLAHDLCTRVVLEIDCKELHSEVYDIRHPASLAQIWMTAQV